MAFSRSPVRCSSSMWASTTSREVTSPALMATARPVAERSVSGVVGAIVTLTAQDPDTCVLTCASRHRRIPSDGRPGTRKAGGVRARGAGRARRGREVDDPRRAGRAVDGGAEGGGPPARAPRGGRAGRGGRAAPGCLPGAGEHARRGRGGAGGRDDRQGGRERG